MKKRSSEEMDQAFRNKLYDFESDPLPETKEEVFLRIFSSQLQEQNAGVKKQNKIILFFEKNKYSLAAVCTGVMLTVSVFLINFEKGSKQSVKSTVVFHQENLEINTSTSSPSDVKNIDESVVVKEERKNIEKENSVHKELKNESGGSTGSNLTTYSTGEEKISLYLPDSSKVYLNRYSELSYMENSKGSREVNLSGEAFFEVKKRKKDLFVINTNSSKVKVLGTSFSVKALPQKKEEVVVLSGTVLFYSKVTSAKEVLSAGDKGYYDLRNRIVKIKAFNRNELSWKENKLEFNKTPMEQVIRDIKRHFNVSVTIANEGIDQCHFTGVFENPSLEEVLQVLALSVNGTYEIKNNECVLRGKGCN